MTHKLFLLLPLLFAFGHKEIDTNYSQRAGKVPATACYFETSDTSLQRLYNVAEEKAAKNVRKFSDQFTVLVEGAEYGNVWIETQPMGGAMYAKRNVLIARNNQLIFMDRQREDGKIPSMIGPISDYQYVKHLPFLDLSKDSLYFQFWGSIQGYNFPEPALEVYFLLNKDTAYLTKLYKCLELFDAFLWRTRDSDNNGCLEAWCTTDNGEDQSIRFKGAPDLWANDFAPTGKNLPPDINPEKSMVPYESMDMMAYSYSGRKVLAEISAIKGNGKTNYWYAKAKEVKDKMSQFLWRPEKHAYYDRDKNNEFLPTLIHNSLRTMNFGTMSQEMADDFIKFHLLNPDEFWTPMPLPSIAANDPLFQNSTMNNWSGQPQGLTYQRAIKALENYGHFAEVTLIGHKLLDKTARTLKFTQQFDPFTGEQNGGDGYGPTILSVLEYISRMYGVNISKDTVSWNGLALPGNKYSYTQKWGDKTFNLNQENDKVRCSINATPLFTCTAGVKIVTDLKGKVIELAVIDTVPIPLVLAMRGKIYKALIKPNEVYYLKNEKLVLKKKVPFDYPYRK
ncbi:MAG TPA: hypothetical protein VF691_09350 [Cytophagaceae bacterium]|jgi:hypothetical protein